MIDDKVVQRKDFKNRYREYVEKVMLTTKKYQGKKISDVEYVEYEKIMSKNFLKDTKLTDVNS